MINNKLDALCTEKVKQYFEGVLTGEVRQALSEGARAGYWIYCNFLLKINSATESVGKDGKFQIFVCVGIRSGLTSVHS